MSMHLFSLSPLIRRCCADVDHCFFHSNNHESGVDNILTQWIPWSDVSVQTGGLAVLRGSNSLPGFRRMRETYMDVDVSATDIEDAGAFTDDPHELLRYDPDCQWVTSDFRAGDVLVFTMHTFHGGVVNSSEDALRIRQTSAGCPLTTGWMAGTRCRALRRERTRTQAGRHGRWQRPCGSGG